MCRLGFGLWCGIDSRDVRILNTAPDTEDHYPADGHAPANETVGYAAGKASSIMTS